MSREVFTKVIRGAHAWVRQAEEQLQAAIAEHGPDRPVGWGLQTSYYLPMSYALMGLEAKTLGDLRAQVAHARELLRPEPAEALWLPYLGDGLDAGAASMLATEVLVALRSVNGYQTPAGWQGFISDTIMRELGIQLVDGRMPGFALILGPAPTTEIAVEVVRELQKRSILTFLCANRDGRTAREQMIEGGVLKDDAPLKECWDQYVVPVGPDSLDSIYVLNWSIRSALTFGGHKRGESRKCLDYTKRRIHAFGITFGEIPDDWFALGAGAILMGYPVISDTTTTPQVRPTGVTVREAIGGRNRLPSPRAHLHRHPRGEGERSRRSTFPWATRRPSRANGCARTTCTCSSASSIRTPWSTSTWSMPARSKTARSRLPGRISTPSLKAGRCRWSIEVLVAGRKMQHDFEGILERQIHRWLSHAMGFMHTGQRDQIWCRISKKSFRAGLRLKHLGTILHAKLHDEYAGIVDKVAVRISSLPEVVQAKIAEAREAFRIRDDRIAGMTDESVETFYSCTICQSYAPDHVCVITPQRLGLCGAYNWLDGRANYEINPTGPNQPIAKGRTVDSLKGEWEGVNKFVYQHSNHKIERFCAYSLLESPMTSCGCFECIVAVLPLANGVMIVNREYAGTTPSGMTFRRSGVGQRRRGADPRLLGRGPAVLVQPEVPRGRRRHATDRVDAEVAQGSRPRTPSGRGGAARRSGAVGQDRHRGEWCDGRRSDRTFGGSGAPGPRAAALDFVTRPGS